MDDSKKRKSKEGKKTKEEKKKKIKGKRWREAMEVERIRLRHSVEEGSLSLIAVSDAHNPFVEGGRGIRHISYLSIDTVPQTHSNDKKQ